MIYFGHVGVGSPVRIEGRFDEFDLDFDIEYAGPAICFPDKPPMAEAIASDAGAMPLLCAYIIRGYADSVSASSQGGKSRIHLHFEH
jgi:hypothetical protein